MPFLSKEMEESVKNEIVLHPPNSNMRCPPTYPPVAISGTAYHTEQFLRVIVARKVHLSPISAGYHCLYEEGKPHIDSSVLIR